MNLPLLIKLVRLANNNPSENEANLAARKVCKMIEEAQFKFNPDPVPSKPVTPPSNSQYYKPSTPGANSPFWNPITRESSEFYEYLKYATRQGPHPPYGPPHTWGNPNPTPKEEKKKDWKTRICSECGQEKLTPNTDMYYRCSTCQWKGKWPET